MSPLAEAEHAHVVDGLVDRFAARYGFETDAELRNLWWEKFRSTPTKTLLLAAQDFLDHETEGPQGGRFVRYVEKHTRVQARIADPGTCPHCDAGWMESRQVTTATSPQGEFTYPPAIYPCRHCEQELHERWRDKWVPEAWKARPITSATVFDYNPTEAVARAKAVAAAATTRNADDL